MEENLSLNGDRTQSDVGRGSRGDGPLNASTPVAVMRPRARQYHRPEVFTGEGVEWSDYLFHFDQVSLWNAWSTYEKALQLSMCLRGAAARVVYELDNEMRGRTLLLICSTWLNGVGQRREESQGIR